MTGKVLGRCYVLVTVLFKIFVFEDGSTFNLEDWNADSPYTSEMKPTLALTQAAIERRRTKALAEA
jgi:hypothetical protein